MINIHNISNLKMFDQEGYSVSCPNDLQKAIQAGIAKKVGKLLNTEGFLDLIPNFNPNEDTKLRIHLTKDGITIQLLERDTNNLKADKSYSEDNKLVTPEIKTRKEKIIKKVDSLFKEPSALDPSARLQSEKIRPLFIPSQSNKEQVPSKIHFDATLSNPQTQQLHARIEDLQNQLNKKAPYPEELQTIKDQLVFLNQAIQSLKQENITYPHTEEYALINKLVDNQRDIYRALLDLLSRNLNQSPTTQLISPPAQEIENSALKEMLLKLQQEKTDLEQANNLTGQSYKEASQALVQKEKEIVTLQEKLGELSPLPLQLSNLQQEKVNLESEHAKLIEQLTQARENQTQLAANYNNEVEILEKSNTVLQKQLSNKDVQIAELDKQVKNSGNTHQELERQLSQLRKEKTDLEQTSAQSNKESFQLLAQKQHEIVTLQEKLEKLSQLPLQLSNLQQEKETLKLEHGKLIEQLTQARLTQAELSTDYNNKIEQLESSNTVLQKQLSTKDVQITELDKQIKNSGNIHEELERQYSQLQQEKTDLEQANNLTGQSYKEASQALVQKEKEIVTLQEKLGELSNLQKEKDDLALELENLTGQLNQAKEAQAQSDIDYTNKTEQLERSNRDLQANIFDKDNRIAELDKQIKSSGITHQELERQLSLLRQEKEESSQLSTTQKEQEIVALQGKLERLSNLQQEKEALELERIKLKNQLDQASQNQSAFLEFHQNEKTSLQMQLSTKDEQIFELNEEIQRLSEAHQALQNQLKDEKEIVNILETATMPEISSEIASISTTIEEAKNKMEHALSSLENSSIQESLLTSTSGYYTLTAMPSLEESLETATEITTLQAEINDLLEELENIRPIAYNTTLKIEKMEKSNKDLTLKLSEKTKTIEELEEEKKFLESQLDRSELRLKDLQRDQHTFNEQQKRISISSEENDDLLNELEKIQEQLSSEKRERAKLEQAYEDRLEELKDLYDENALEKMEHINEKIISLQKQQKNTCLSLVTAIEEYMRSESITENIGQSIIGLIEQAFNTTGTEYKTLLALVSSEVGSEEENLASSEESVSAGEYDEDSYMI